MPRLATAVLVTVLGAAGSPAQVLINELLYDPEGSDGGQEFVELIGPPGEALTGLALESCDGGNPGNWRELWKGGDDDRLDARGLFLVGEAAVLPPPQVSIPLGLQNGPDALRLIHDGQVLDMIGYGEGLPPELCEAWPAEDAGSGRSLARFPDGADSDQNALDFFTAEPSPGRLNDPELALAITEARLPIPPPEPGLPWTLRVLVENRGRAPWPGPMELCAGPASALLRNVAPGHSSAADLVLSGSSAGLLELRLSAQGGDPFLTDSLDLRLRLGLGELLLSEIQFAPETGRSEWIECLAPRGLLPSGRWSLVDLEGEVYEFQPPALAAGERLLLCQDREALLQEHPELPVARVLELDAWPSLANEGESLAWPPWSDGLRLQDEEGLDSDGLLYSGDWILGKGQSLERLYDYGPAGSSAWAPCPLGSSPLDGPSPTEPAARPGWSLSPQPFDPDREAVEFYRRESGAAAHLKIFDAAGRVIQELEGPLGSGNLRLLWDGRDRAGRALPSGAYPFLLSWEDSRGGEQQDRGCCLLLRGRP